MSSADWENDTLPRFLDAASRWVSSMEGAYRWAGEEVPIEPTWDMIARIFLAATAYE